MKRRYTSLMVTLGVLAFMYLPILALVMQSFNRSRFGGNWEGFSLKWYAALFNDETVLEAMGNTLLVALAATVVSVVLGTGAAWALNRYRSKLQKLNYAVISTPLMVPDLLMGISLLLLFVNLGLSLGLTTVILAHITFCVSFVTFTVLARLQDFDFNLIAAARDLGAGHIKILFKIIVPLIAPGIVAGALMAFTLSMDDFVITFFVGGPGSTTLPVKVYSMIKHGSPAVINAVSVVFMAVTLSVALAGQFLMRKKY